jgi:hypothetical protein
MEIIILRHEFNFSCEEEERNSKYRNHRNEFKIMLKMYLEI